MINLLSSYMYKPEFKIVKKNEAAVLKRIKNSLTNSSNNTRLVYYNQYKRVLKYVERNIEWELKESFTKKFEFLSASIHYLLPEVKEEDHLGFYFGVEKWRNLTFDHSKNPSMLNSVENFSLDNKSITSDRSALYVTYKFGSNQSIIGYLIANNIKIMLLIDESAYKNKEVFSELIEGVQKTFNSKNPYKIINVEDPKAVLMMASYIKKGYSALAFLDGNSGSGGQYVKKNTLTKIHFLNGELVVRQGIAKLGLMLKIPIVPIVSCIDEESQIPKFDIFPDILFETNRDSKIQVKEVTQQLWNILESKVKIQPHQWDGWDRVHRFFDLEELKKIHFSKEERAVQHDKYYGLNRVMYRVFKIDKKSFLLNRNTFEIFEIETDLFDLINSRFGNSPTLYIKSGIEFSLLQELIDNEILIIKKNKSVWKTMKLF